MNLNTVRCFVCLHLVCVCACACACACLCGCACVCVRVRARARARVRLCLCLCMREIVCVLHVSMCVSVFAYTACAYKTMIQCVCVCVCVGCEFVCVCWSLTLKGHGESRGGLRAWFCVSCDCMVCLLAWLKVGEGVGGRNRVKKGGVRGRDGEALGLNWKPPQGLNLLGLTRDSNSLNLEGINNRNRKESGKSGREWGVLAESL